MAAITVHCVRARNLAAADSNGFSDPYVILKSGAQKKKSKTIKKTLDPEWNEQLTIIPKPGVTQLVLHVYDWDLGSSDDFLGELVFDVNQLSLDGQENWYTLQGRQGKTDTHVKGDILLAFTKSGMSTSSAPQKDPTSVVDQIKKRIQAAQLAGNEADFSACELTKIPRVVTDTLSGVDTLDLGFNKFVDWPAGLDAFKNLSILHMEGNQLTHIAPEIGDLVGLTELYCHGNQIDNFPVELGKCKKLEKLNLANCQVESLPNEIGLLEYLEDLDLNGNPLSSLPEGIGCCRRLEVVDLSCCNLTSIPDQITHCTALLELNLGTNELTALPEATGKLTRLVMLNLADNQLTDLPVSMGHCRGLSKFGAGCNIERNQIADATMLQKFKVGPDHLVDYLEKRMAVMGEPNMKDPKYHYQLPYGNEPAPQAQQQEQHTPKPTLMEQNIAAQQQQQQAQASVAGMEEKLNALKKWANGVIQQDMRGKLSAIQERSNTAADPNVVVGLATIISQMQPTLQQVKTSIEPFDPPMPDASSSAPKIDQLKAVVTASCAEVAMCMRGIQRALAKARDQARVVELIQHTKALKAHLDKAQA
jgi:C2 domain/Leucine rich repeat/Leucine Rich repeats (2 copies)